MGHNNSGRSNHKDLRILIEDACYSKNERELKDKLRKIETFIDEHHSDVLLDFTDSKGSTYLNYVMYFPFKVQNNKSKKQFAEMVSFKLTNLLLDKMQARLHGDDFAEKILKGQTYTGFMVLQSAVMTGSSMIVERLIEVLKQYPKLLEANLENRNNKGLTVLDLAVTKGYELNVKHILEALKHYPKLLEANLHNRDNGGFMLLQSAVASGSAPVVECVLESLEKYPQILKANLTNHNKSGFMVLLGAVASRSAPIFERVLEVLARYPEILKANLECRSDDCFTVLHSALKSGSEHIVKNVLEVLSRYPQILEASLNNLETKGGYMVLQEALKSCDPVVEQVLEALAQYPHTLKANLKNRTKAGFMVLQSVLASGSEERILERVLSALAQYPEILMANLENVTGDGLMAVPQALSTGSAGVVEQVLEPFRAHPNILKKNVMSVPSSKNTLLHNALRRSPQNPSNLLTNVNTVLALYRDYLSKAEQKMLLAQANFAGYNILHNAANTNEIEVFNCVISAFEHAYGEHSSEILHKLALSKTIEGYLPIGKISKEINMRLSEFKRPEFALSSNIGLVGVKQAFKVADPLEAKALVNQKKEKQTERNAPAVNDNITLSTIDAARADIGDNLYNHLKKICYIMLPTTNRAPYRQLKDIVIDLEKNTPHDVKCVLMVGLNNEDNPEALIRDVAEFKDFCETKFSTVEVHIDGFNWHVDTGQKAEIKVPFGAIRNRILTSTLKHIKQNYADSGVEKVLITLDADTRIHKQSFEDLFKDNRVNLDAGSLGYIYDEETLKHKSRETGPLVALANRLDMRIRTKLNDLGYLAECSLFMKGQLVEDLLGQLENVHGGDDLPLFSAGGAESRGLIKYCQEKNYRYGQYFDEAHAPKLSKIPSEEAIDWLALNNWNKKSPVEKYKAVKNVLFNHTYSNANYRFFVNQLRFALNLFNVPPKGLTDIASQFYIPNLIAQNKDKNFAGLIASLSATLLQNRDNLLSARSENMGREEYEKMVAACYAWGAEVIAFIERHIAGLKEIRDAIKFGQGSGQEQGQDQHQPTDVQPAQFGARNMFYGASKCLADIIRDERKKSDNKKRQNTNKRDAHEAALSEHAAKRHEPQNRLSSSGGPVVQTLKRESSQAREGVKRCRAPSPEAQTADEMARLDVANFAASIKVGIADPLPENSADEEMINNGFGFFFSKRAGMGVYDNLVVDKTRSEEREEKRANIQIALNEIEIKRAERAHREAQRKRKEEAEQAPAPEHSLEPEESPSNRIGLN